MSSGNPKQPTGGGLIGASGNMPGGAIRSLVTPENPMSFVTSSWVSPSPDATRSPEDADRFSTPRFCASNDEVIVIDEKSGLTPSQAVENRLVALLRETSLPVSHLKIRGLMGRGRRDD